VVSGGGAGEYVAEPARERCSDLIRIRWVEEEVGGVGLFVEVLPNEEVDAAVVALLDPLGIGIVPSADGDLGGDVPVVVFVPNGAEWEVEATVSLVFEVLDAVL